MDAKILAASQSVVSTRRCDALDQPSLQGRRVPLCWAEGCGHTAGMTPGATGFVARAHGAAKHESESRRRTRATTGRFRALAPRWDP